MSRLGNRPHSIGASPPPVPVTLCCGHVPSMACRSEIRACSCVPWLGTATPSRRCRSQTASTPPLFTAKPSERTKEPCCDCGFRPDCGPQARERPLAGLVRHATPAHRSSLFLVVLQGHVFSLWYLRRILAARLNEQAPVNGPPEFVARPLALRAYPR